MLRDRQRTTPGRTFLHLEAERGADVLLTRLTCQPCSMSRPSRTRCRFCGSTAALPPEHTRKTLKQLPSAVVVTAAVVTCRRLQAQSECWGTSHDDSCERPRLPAGLWSSIGSQWRHVAM